MKLFGRLKCTLGWHNWTSKIQDYLDEFGYVPLDSRISSNAKCSRCNKKYINESK